VNFPTNIVVVTGAAGWLGRGLVQALVCGLADDERLAKPQTNLRIRCLVQPREEAAFLKSLSPQVEIVEGDVRVPGDCAALLRGTEGAVLFHAAGIIHPRRVSDFFDINLNGTKNLLDAAISAKIRRAVVVSSNSPCGCNPHLDHLFDETSPYHPYLNYGRSKMQMELVVKERQQAGEIETVIIRPPWFYGPNQPPRQTEFFRMIRDGKMPIVGSGANRRSMAYIDNLVQGLMLAALTPKAVGETYWIADERPYEMNEIVDVVERLLEKEFGQKCAHRRMKLPGLASEVAFLIDASLQGLGLYHQKFHVLSEMNKTIACSVGKAKAELGYAPHVALEEGMRRSLRWIVEKGGGLDAVPSK
jgi:nucleoside-diphosphate-sugar epimerase